MKNVQFVNDESVKLDWVYNDDFIDASGKANVVIAAYTTAQARRKLYSYLWSFGKIVLQYRLCCLYNGPGAVGAAVKLPRGFD